MNNQQIYTLDAMHNLADTLARLCGTAHIITFTGPLGAGKTTLIRELMACWGVTSGVTSPTFTYMQQYVLPTGMRVFHFDLYRLESVDEFIALGFDEYLHQPNSKVLIEWPAVIDELLNESVCHVTLDYCMSDMTQRVITMKCPLNNELQK